MTVKTRCMICAFSAVSLAAGLLIAENGFDEDSALALEEMAIEEAVIGNLPESSPELESGIDLDAVEPGASEDQPVGEDVVVEEKGLDDDDMSLDDIEAVLEHFEEMPPSEESSDLEKDLAGASSVAVAADDMDDDPLAAAAVELGLAAELPEATVAETAPTDTVPDPILEMSSNNVEDLMLAPADDMPMPLVELDADPIPEPEQPEPSAALPSDHDPLEDIIKEMDVVVEAPAMQEEDLLLDEADIGSLDDLITGDDEISLDAMFEEADAIENVDVAEDVDAADAFAPVVVVEDADPMIEATQDEPPAGFMAELIAEEEAGLEEAPAAPRVSASPAPAAGAREPDVASYATAELLERIAREEHGKDMLKDGELALSKRDYALAIARFEEALVYLSSRPDQAGTRQRTKRGLAAAYYLRALSFERMDELDKAKAAALSAVKYGYLKAESAVRRIQSKIDGGPAEVERPQVNRWDQDDYRSTASAIAEWLKRGRQAYLTGEYELAIRCFESVLARDPENKEAIRLTRSAAQKQYDRSSMELEATRTRMMATVRDTWNPRDYGLHETPIDDEVGTTGTVKTDDSSMLLILDKMAKIRLPEVDFRQANIRDVIDFLHEQSVEFDRSENPSDRKGVNFILKLPEDQGGGGAGGAAADPFGGDAADPFGGFGDDVGADDGGGGAEGDVLVTFSALDITLRDALDIVVEVAALKYRIKGNVVMIVPRDSADGTIEHRMYDVLPTVVERIQGLLESVVDRPQQRGGGEFIQMDDAGTDTDRGDWKTFFGELGVSWPKASSIKYVAGIGKIIVANTAENLAVFETVLSVLNVVPYQIEIEARFVEVAQTDIDSLGFEWMLNDDWEMFHKSSDSDLPPSARQRIQMTGNSHDGGFTSGMRYLNGADRLEPISDNVLNFSSVLTNPELGFILHALQQRGHTDVLSAPKITAQSGQEATIKVVTEYIYPTEFETEGISGGSSGNNNNNSGGGTVGAIVTPSSFETREVGVILNVVPEVSPEGQMINLTLAPEVVSEPTWRNYGSTYESDVNQDGVLETQQLNMEQPFFHTRSLSTSMLIYNGATVVMGGMITEQREDVDDKVPILGDIPLLGRLFRSNYEQSVKRNLLIFVTARLVDPAGRPLDRERFGISDSIASKLVPTDGSTEE